MYYYIICVHSPFDFNAGNCYWKGKLKGREDGGGDQKLPE